MGPFFCGKKIKESALRHAPCTCTKATRSATVQTQEQTLACSHRFSCGRDASTQNHESGRPLCGICVHVAPHENKKNIIIPPIRVGEINNVTAETHEAQCTSPQKLKIHATLQKLLPSFLFSLTVAFTLPPLRRLTFVSARNPRPAFLREPFRHLCRMLWPISRDSCTAGLIFGVDGGAALGGDGSIGFSSSLGHTDTSCSQVTCPIVWRPWEITALPRVLFAGHWIRTIARFNAFNIGKLTPIRPSSSTPPPPETRSSCT